MHEREEIPVELVFLRNHKLSPRHPAPLKLKETVTYYDAIMLSVMFLKNSLYFPFSIG